MGGSAEFPVGTVQLHSLGCELTGKWLPDSVSSTALCRPAPQRGTATCRPAPRLPVLVLANTSWSPKESQGWEVSWDKTAGHTKRLAHRRSLSTIKQASKSLTWVSWLLCIQVMEEAGVLHTCSGCSRWASQSPRKLRLSVRIASVPPSHRHPA